jgi:hypothetical protein
MIRNCPESVTNLAQTRLFSLLDLPRPIPRGRRSTPGSANRPPAAQLGWNPLVRIEDQQAERLVTRTRQARRGSCPRLSLSTSFFVSTAGLFGIVCPTRKTAAMQSAMAVATRLKRRFSRSGRSIRHTSRSTGDLRHGDRDAATVPSRRSRTASTPATSRPRGSSVGTRGALSGTRRPVPRARDA